MSRRVWEESVRAQGRTSWPVPPVSQLSHHMDQGLDGGQQTQSQGPDVICSSLVVGEVRRPISTMWKEGRGPCTP